LRLGQRPDSTILTVKIILTLIFINVRNCFRIANGLKQSTAEEQKKIGKMKILFVTLGILVAAQLGSQKDLDINRYTIFSTGRFHHTYFSMLDILGPPVRPQEVSKQSWFSSVLKYLIEQYRERVSDRPNGRVAIAPPKYAIPGSVAVFFGYLENLLYLEISN